MEREPRPGLPVLGVHCKRAGVQLHPLKRSRRGGLPLRLQGVPDRQPDAFSDAVADRERDSVRNCEHDRDAQRYTEPIGDFYREHHCLGYDDAVCQPGRLAIAVAKWEHDAVAFADPVSNAEPNSE